MSYQGTLKREKSQPTWEEVPMEEDLWDPEWEARQYERSMRLIIACSNISLFCDFIILASLIAILIMLIAAK